MDNNTKLQKEAVSNRKDDQKGKPKKRGNRNGKEQLTKMHARL